MQTKTVNLAVPLDQEKAIPVEEIICWLHPKNYATQILLATLREFEKLTLRPKPNEHGNLLNGVVWSETSSGLFILCAKRLGFILNEKQWTTHYFQINTMEILANYAHQQKLNAKEKDHP